MTKLWGGRFKKGLANSAEALSYSMEADKRLYPYDIKVNMAHVKALQAAGILSQDEASALSEALEDLLARFADDYMDAELPDEDIHSCVERLLVERCGDLGKKLHTGKSRNDQVATDARLLVKDEIDQIDGLLQGFLKSLLNLAKANQEIVFPGFTHLQVAQPIMFAHHILAYIEKFQRDRERLQDARKRADFCPLGSAAMAGSNYPLDRDLLAKELGFAGVTQNSMDAVSDRDFILETLSALAIAMAHMSQLCEELIFWSSPVVGFITIGDDFTTGSSIMPQKKNPDMAELVRGKTGKFLGAFVGLHELMKGLPLTYNRDMQEDKPYLYESVDTFKLVLDCFTEMMPTITLNKAAIDESLTKGHICATEIADYLVIKGVPFRDAHEITGQVVQYADEKGMTLDQISVSEYQNFSDAIAADIQDVLTCDKAVARKALVGGTAPSQVAAQIQRLEGLL